MNGIIYKMKILTTGDYYVGQTCKINDFHTYYGSGRVWKNKIKKIKKKYPTCWKKLIKREILWSGECNQKLLDKLEEVYIRKEKALIDLNLGGCNILPGTANKYGEGCMSKQPYVRKKISESNSGKKCSNANKKLFSEMYMGSGNPFYGKHHTEESREKIRKNRKPFIWTDELRKKVSETLKKKYESGEIINSMKGKHHTEETKKKLSKHFSGKNNPMYGISLSGKKHPRYGKHWDEEHKKHQSEIIKKKYENGEMVSPFKGKHHTEETKKKLSESKIGKYIGKNNPFYGKHHTDETREKMRQQRLLKYAKK